MIDVKVSSGNSKIYIYPNHVEKVFSSNKDFSKEIKILKDINSKYIVNVLEYTNNSISYERVIPLTEIPDFIAKDTSFFIKILLNIASALCDIHKKGYFHGDVAKGNIGLNKMGDIVLYDTEEMDTGTSIDYYKDVKMFLDDMKIHYKDNGQVIDIINNLLQDLDKTITTQQIEVLFLGKKRLRSIKNSDYKPCRFGSIVLSI